MIRGVEPDYPLEQFKAAPVRKGSLVLIHGNVIHRSERNTSAKEAHMPEYMTCLVICLETQDRLTNKNRTASGIRCVNASSTYFAA